MASTPTQQAIVYRHHHNENYQPYIRPKPHTRMSADTDNKNITETKENITERTNNNTNI